MVLWRPLLERTRKSLIVTHGLLPKKEKEKIETEMERSYSDRHHHVRQIDSNRQTDKAIGRHTDTDRLTEMDGE